MLAYRMLAYRTHTKRGQAMLAYWDRQCWPISDVGRYIHSEDRQCWPVPCNQSKGRRCRRMPGDPRPVRSHAHQQAGGCQASAGSSPSDILNR